jgi:hypothetical protein
MKKIKILLSVTMLLVASVVFAQAEKSVSAIKAGSKLTDADIGFLSMVSNADLSSSRGAGPATAKVSNKSYAAGQTLTADDAKAINTAIKSFQKTYKAPKATRGDLCYYWYYYCDGSGYCYYYKYYYYC